MNEILPGVYRFSQGKKSRSHAYLLVREAGNLLLLYANQGSSAVDFLDEVERLGGIAYQFVPHRHAAAGDGLHERLYERFGCPLSYHERDRKQIAKKTDCPAFEFGDEGLEMGDDFCAIDLGRTVFHWSQRDKRLLFPGQAIKRHGQAWDVQLDPHSDLAAPLARGLEMPVDYLLPGHTSPEDDDYHTFTDGSLKAYRQAIRDSLKPAEKSVEARLRLGERVEKEELEPGPSHLFTNYVTAHLNEVTQALGLFAIHRVPGGASGKMEILFTSLELADVFFFYDFRRAFGPEHGVWERLRRYVEEGGALFISDVRPKVSPRWLAGGHPFPEVALWGNPPEGPGNELTVCEGHPAIGAAPGEAPFESGLYQGGSLEPGDRGYVLARNAAGRPVAVAGEVGKGRVVFSSFFFHPLRDPARGTKAEFLQGVFRWLAG